jgi:hypothetical protein
MTARERFHCVVLHAERLERDAVWRATRRFLRWVAAAGGRATVFVHPLSAIEARTDLGPRLREIADGGHEIGQHTHFYAPREPGSDAPTTDLSPSVVRGCLERDLAYLRAAGFPPRGFTSGGWAIVPDVSEWLRSNAFDYDSSYRSFDLTYANAAAAPGGGSTAAVARDGIVRLPTTASVRVAIEAVLYRRDESLRAPGFRYDLAYTHDYDLVVARRQIAAHALVRAWRSGPWRTAGELAELVQRGAA